MYTIRDRAQFARRIINFVALLVASWCVMTFTHEMGHIVAGWCCGGTLRAADLRPWSLPYSLFDPDPRPLVTLWSGPILGIVAPLVIASIVRREWMWFIAHFCILANGGYLAAAWLSGDHFLDTAKLLEHGAHPLAIAGYCLVSIGFGYVGFRRSCVRIFASPPSSESN